MGRASPSARDRVSDVAGESVASRLLGRVGGGTVVTRWSQNEGQVFSVLMIKFIAPL